MFTEKIWSGQDIQFSQFTSQQSAVQAIFSPGHYVTIGLRSNLHKWRISQITCKAELDSSWVPETMPHTVTQLCLYNFITANGRVNTLCLVVFHIFSCTVNAVVVSKMLVINLVIFPDRQAFSWSDLIW
jgi:hypothetical protein